MRYPEIQLQNRKLSVGFEIQYSDNVPQTVFKNGRIEKVYKAPIKMVFVVGIYYSKFKDNKRNKKVMWSYTIVDESGKELGKETGRTGKKEGINGLRVIKFEKPSKRKLEAVIDVPKKFEEGTYFIQIEIAYLTNQGRPMWKFKKGFYNKFILLHKKKNPTSIAEINQEVTDALYHFDEHLVREGQVIAMEIVNSEKLDQSFKNLFEHLLTFIHNQQIFAASNEIAHHKKIFTTNIEKFQRELESIESTIHEFFKEYNRFWKTLSGYVKKLRPIISDTPQQNDMNVGYYRYARSLLDAVETFPVKYRAFLNKEGFSTDKNSIKLLEIKQFEISIGRIFSRFKELRSICVNKIDIQQISKRTKTLTDEVDWVYHNQIKVYLLRISHIIIYLRNFEQDFRMKSAQLRKLERSLAADYNEKYAGQKAT